MKNRGRINTLVLGYYGARNLGDDMMLKAIILWLKKQSRDATVISENPPDTKQRFHVNSVLNVPMLLQWSWVGTIFKGLGAPLLKAFFACDELVVGGGDLIRDTKGWGFFWYTMEKILFALLLNKPVYLVGVGIAEPTQNWSRTCLKFLLKKCQQIYVRDLESLQLCDSLGLKNAQLMPDIATVLHSYHDHEKKQMASSYCLVTLRHAPNVYGCFNVDEDHYQQLAVALDALISETGMNVVFNPYQEHTDNMVHKKVMAHMQQKQFCTLNEWNGDVMAAFALAANAELIIGMRLHSIIAGVCSNVRCIALPYDYKIESFCDLAGIDDKIYPQDMLGAEGLLKIMLNCLSKIPANTYLPATMWNEVTLD